MTLPASDTETTLVLLRATTDEVRALTTAYEQIRRRLAERKRDLAELLVVVELREGR